MNIATGRLLNRFGQGIETIDRGSLQAVNTSLETFLAAILTVESVVFFTHT
jgi:uncharacterized protein YifE (UPF0438 family)